MRTRRLFRKLTGTKQRAEISELSTSAIHQAVLRAVQELAPPGFTGEHLDVGSGTGELLRILARHYPLHSFACDYTDELMEKPDQKVHIVDLNRNSLPFANDRFAIVTCIELIEHLENHRNVIRELYRVLRPGGLAVLSTPNILNLRSRLRYLSSGFYNLFGPLAPNETKIHSPRGHINPVSWFYLAHALLSAGFQDLRFAVDKYQRRSFFAFPFLILPIQLGNAIVYRRDAKKYGTLNEQNAWIVRAMNSRDLLLGRTVIVTAVKPQ
jgi:ubiquinone/menaquinone biosynthesis C-methylase UbiE